MTDDAYKNIVYEAVKFKCGECRKPETDPQGGGWLSPESKKKNPYQHDFTSQGVMLKLCKGCRQGRGLPG